MKHLFIELTIREGEMEHDHRILHKTNCKDKLFAARWYAAHYWDDEFYHFKDSDWLYVHNGEMGIRVDGVYEISEFEYKLMEKIMYGHYKEKNYFEIVHAGFDDAAQREQIEINAGEYGKILIFQDDGKLGFIIDVYGNDDHHSTLPVWEEDLAPMSEDDDPLSESAAPENFSMSELEDFVDEWGQTHDEICDVLDYDPEDDGSSEMLIGDGYKWFERWQKWLAKSNSMYSEREQAIMDYILVTYC